jgi:hypothetical protein
VVVPLVIDSDRIVGIQFEYSPGQYIFIFQVYLPCSKHSIENYRLCIDKMFELFYLYVEKGETVMGDFNARLFGTHAQTRDNL